MVSANSCGVTRIGVSRVPGIAVGSAVLWRMDPPRPRVVGPRDEEHARLAAGIAMAKAGVSELMNLLPRTEAELFEPELMILDELATTLEGTLLEGMCAEEVVERAMAEAAVDLLVDARARILDAMAQSYRSVDAHLAGFEGDVVLVTDALTPSIVASLPSRVVGIVTTLVSSGGSSGEGSGERLEGIRAACTHAELLARERDITLALFSPDDVALLVEGDAVVVDATADAATISLSATAEAADQARVSRHAWLHARDEEDAQAASPLDHLGVGVFVNVGSLHERVPASAEGIGLVRTELLFANHACAPSEAAQFGLVCAVAALAPRSRAVVRLFDAGGDKPLPWLSPPQGAEDARGIELLLHHRSVLETQVRALVRVAEHVGVCVLVPYVRGARDIDAVRELVGGRLAVGALIETVEAVARIDEIVAVADFLSIGTNDLAASVTGNARENAGLSLDVRLLRAIESIAAAGRRRGRHVTVCGEIAGDAHAARVMVGLGVRGISTAPTRVVAVKRSLRGASLDDCRSIARAAIATSTSPSRAAAAVAAGRERN